MADIPYTPPKLGRKAFNCPLCQAYAQQGWSEVYYASAGNPGKKLDGFARSRCLHCSEALVWYEGRIVVPDVSAAPPPNGDLADDIKADFSEAASIVSKSPRGAAALLRLCVQKLCIQLGQSGKNLNNDIRELGARGLPAEI